MTPETIVAQLRYFLTNYGEVVRAISDRQRVAEAVRAGETIDDPRIEFLQNGTMLVVSMLLQYGEEFNAAYDGPKVTVLDLLDILMSANKTLERLVVGED